MLTKHQLALLALLNQKNSDFDFSTLTEADWQEVLTESQTQSVTISALDGTKACCKYIPKDIYSKWLSLSMQFVLNNAKVAKSQAELVEILNKNGFRYIILKGLVSASYYPSPEKRILGDVDFLIDKSEQAVITSVLENEGYLKLSDDHPNHISFKKGSRHLEMHFSIAGIPHGAAGDAFNNFFKGALNEPTTDQNGGYRRPSTAIHGAIILLHTLHHMLDKGLGLRHLCDWAYFVDKTYHEPFWEESLLPVLRKTGTLKFAAIITKTAHLYLGTALPEWASNESDSLCEEVINDFLAAGNLGKKDYTRAIAAHLISEYGKDGKSSSKFKNQLTTLKNSMYYLYPFLHKWKILYPFVFVWRIIRYLWLMLLGKRPNIIKTNHHANARLSLYRQFELYKTTEE